MESDNGGMPIIAFIAADKPWAHRQTIGEALNQRHYDCQVEKNIATEVTENSERVGK